MKLQELGNSMNVNRVLYHDNSAVMNIKQHQGSKEALSPSGRIVVTVKN